MCSVRGRHTETAAYGAFSSLPRVPAKVLSAILCRPPSSCNANRWPVEFTAYALASRLRASWMEARVTKLAGVSARFSKSLARHRFRPNQEKARSTTPAARRDDEAPHVVVALDDLDRSSGTFATAASTCLGLSPPSAKSVTAAAIVVEQPIFLGFTQSVARLPTGNFRRSPLRRPLLAIQMTNCWYSLRTLPVCFTYLRPRKHECPSGN